MAVRVIDKQTGKATQGKYASLKGGQVNLFSGIMADKKGGFRGCGKKLVFPSDGVTLEADNWAQEIKEG